MHWSASPAASGASGPTITASTCFTLCERDQRGHICHRRSGTHVASAAIPGFPGAAISVTSGCSCSDAPRQRMFAATAADKQKLHGAQFSRAMTASGALSCRLCGGTRQPRARMNRRPCRMPRGPAGRSSPPHHARRQHTSVCGPVPSRRGYSPRYDASHRRRVATQRCSSAARTVLNGCSRMAVLMAFSNESHDTAFTLVFRRLTQEGVQIGLRPVWSIRRRDGRTYASRASVSCTASNDARSQLSSDLRLHSSSASWNGSNASPARNGKRTEADRCSRSRQSCDTSCARWRCAPTSCAITITLLIRSLSTDDARRC